MHDVCVHSAQCTVLTSQFRALCLVSLSPAAQRRTSAETALDSGLGWLLHVARRGPSGARILLDVFPLNRVNFKIAHLYRRI